MIFTFLEEFQNRLDANLTLLQQNFDYDDIVSGFPNVQYWGRNGICVPESGALWMLTYSIDISQLSLLFLTGVTASLLLINIARIWKHLLKAALGWLNWIISRTAKTLFYIIPREIRGNIFSDVVQPLPTLVWWREFPNWRFIPRLRHSNDKHGLPSCTINNWADGPQVGEHEGGAWLVVVEQVVVCDPDCSKSSILHGWKLLSSKSRRALQSAVAFHDSRLKKGMRYFTVLESLLEM